MGAAEKAIELCELTVALHDVYKITMPFLDALVLRRERSVTTSADHVYGVLSLLDRQGLPFMPNYKESTMSVFCNAMQHIIQTDGNFDILSACQFYNIGNQQCHDDKALNTMLYRTSHGFRMKVKISVLTVDSIYEKSISYWGFFKRLASDSPDLHAASNGTAELLHYEHNPSNLVSEEDAWRIDISDSFSEVDSGLIKELVAHMKRYQMPSPSWLPDWISPLNEYYRSPVRYLLLSEQKPRFYSAGGHQKPRFSFDRIMPILDISGFQLCSIAHLCPNNQWPEGFWEPEHMRWEWYKGLDNVRNPYGNENGKRTAFVLLEILGKDLDGNESTYQSSFASNTSLLPITIVTSTMSDSHGTQLTDDVPPRRRVGTPGSLDHGLRVWDPCVSEPPTTRPEMEIVQSMLGETREDAREVSIPWNTRDDVRHATYVKVMHIIPHVLWKSRFFVTEQGYVGRGPLSMEKGDAVCIFPGGKTPYILCDAGNGVYYLRGECYVQGIMKGEAMERPHHLKEFILR